MSGRVIDRLDPYGLLEACYRPMVDYDGMGWFAPFWHSYIKDDNGDTYSVTGPESDPPYAPDYHVCVELERSDDSSCSSTTIESIKNCVLNAAEHIGDEGYDFVSNNCGDQVKDAFTTCCAKDPTPGWLFY